jgi:hypothetical protein
MFVERHGPKTLCPGLNDRRTLRYARSDEQDPRRAPIVHPATIDVST